MKLIGIYDYATPANRLPELPSSFKPKITRVAVRGVVTDSAGNYYLMHAVAKGYYKLPGGGVDDGETIEDALHREILEETGYSCRIGGEVGRTIQIHHDDLFLQDSRTYFVELVGEAKAISLTDEEASAGFVVAKFPNLDQAVKAITSSDPRSDSSMLLRDADILNAVRD